MAITPKSQAFVVFDLDNTLFYCPARGKEVYLRRGVPLLLAALSVVPNIKLVFWTRADTAYALYMLKSIEILQFFDSDSMLTMQHCEESKKKYGCYKSCYYLCDWFCVTKESVDVVLVDDVPRNGLNSPYDKIIWVLPFSGPLAPVVGDSDAVFIGQKWNNWQKDIDKKRWKAARTTEAKLESVAVQNWTSYHKTNIVCIPAIDMVYVYLMSRYGLTPDQKVVSYTKKYFGYP